MHRDLIFYSWSRGHQDLIEKMEPDDPRAEGPTRWKQALSGWATYVFITAPHTEQDCRFKDTPTLPITDNLGYKAES
jgi:hypothetical protein